MELDTLGWNAQTLSFIAILAITLMRTYGLFDQARRVWVVRSSASLSVTTFLFFAAAYGVSFVYGQTTRSVALMFSGSVTLVPVLWLLCGIRRAGAFTRWHWFVSGVFATMLIVLCLLPAALQTRVFIGFGVVGAGIIAHQPFTMWKLRSRGVVSGKMLSMMFIGALLWVWYGVAVHDSAIILGTLPYLVVYVVTLVLWLRFRDVKPEIVRAGTA